MPGTTSMPCATTGNRAGAGAGRSSCRRPAGTPWDRARSSQAIWTSPKRHKRPDGVRDKTATSARNTRVKQTQRMGAGREALRDRHGQRLGGQGSGCAGQGGMAGGGAVSLSFTDIFCGAGGSSLGLAGAGLELRLAANHWPRAIETHSANFTEADHLCANVNNYDMRRLPRTDVLWASPICTENSPAGGRKRRPKGQLDLLEEAGHVTKDRMELTRATFHDVIRATEVHRYAAVIVENVTEAADWELWDWWLSGMVLLGYNYQLVSVSAAHIGGENNPYAPQWRDRLYIVFTRHGIRLPAVSPKPLAWCPGCETAVEAFQPWKRPDRPRIRKSGRQC